MNCDAEVERLLDQFDGSGSSNEWRAIRELDKIVGESLPEVLLRRYQSAGRAGARCTCVYLSMVPSRLNDSAFELGKLALQDRSKFVRFRACALLAYSLRMEALPFLRGALMKANPEEHKDISASIDAIEHQNHHYFYDRDHCGKTFWHPEG